MLGEEVNRGPMYIIILNITSEQDWHGEVGMTINIVCIIQLRHVHTAKQVSQIEMWS